MIHHMLLRSLFSLLLVLFSCSQSLTHDWFDADCCSGKDCYVVPNNDAPYEIDNGKWRWHEFVFDKNQVRPSKTGEWAVCIYGKVTPMCVYIVQGF